MNKAEAQMRIKLNINRLFDGGKLLVSRDDYTDNANYEYVENNEKFYKLAGLIR
ncbi:MAG: hypothetical protein LBL50_04590 [Candidatus Margulisbacteria bacterium]|jgi:hypothetical protein|nr:hypothetical protein [Candidatus Margulisiibacteriota bacterium]